MNLFKQIGRVFTDPKGLWDDITGQSTTKKVAQQNYNAQKDALAFQKENLEYQKALQQQIFEREDTAYQRTASDMLKAGLNPLTMNGTNGAGEAIMTQAPDVPKMQDYSRDNSQALLEGIGHASNIVNSAFENASKVGAIKAQYINNERNQKTIDYMNRYGLNDMSPEWLKSATAIQNLIDSKKYLSLIDSAKKLGDDLPPELKKLFIDLKDSTKNNLVETIKEQINANEKNAYSTPPFFISHKSNAYSDNSKNAPKPKISVGGKVIDYFKSTDDLPEYISKRKRLNQRNADYWSNYANQYKK